MDNDIYEVERDEYKTFIGQLNRAKTHTEEYWEDQYHTLAIIGDISGARLCSRVADAEKEEEHYYIFNYPVGEEYMEPKPVLRVNLETREEVQQFVNALAKLQKEHKNG